jgi:hypothetical protein
MKNRKRLLLITMMMAVTVTAFALQYDLESVFDGAKGQTSKKSD